MPAAVVAIAEIVASAAAAVAAVVVPIATAIAAIVAPIVSAISSALSSAGAAISSAVKGLWTGIQTAVTPLVNALKSGIKTIMGAIDTVTSPILTPIVDGLSVINAKLQAIDAWVAAEMKVVHDVIQIASAAATVKLLVDLVKGQVSINEVIGKVAEGKNFETAVAIAELSKSIVTLGVGIVDTIDTHWELIEATYKTWDESFKKELAAAIDVQKAELLALVTPKLDTLGKYSLKVNSEVARLFRHIEDEGWFAAMLIKVLR